MLQNNKGNFSSQIEKISALYELKNEYNQKFIRVNSDDLTITVNPKIKNTDFIELIDCLRALLSQEKECTAITLDYLYADALKYSNGDKYNLFVELRAKILNKLDALAMRKIDKKDITLPNFLKLFQDSELCNDNEKRIALIKNIFISLNKTLMKNELIKEDVNLSILQF